jgi:hypothetical protein
MNLGDHNHRDQRHLRYNKLFEYSDPSDRLCTAVDFKGRSIEESAIEKGVEARLVECVCSLVHCSHCCGFQVSRIQISACKDAR